MTTAKKDDVDVRLVDQEQINEFGRLNNRLMELRAEIKQAAIDNEKLDDATAELMMATSGGDGRVMLLIGEAFIESSEEEATECKLSTFINTINYYTCSSHSRLSITVLARVYPLITSLLFLFHLGNTDCETKQNALQARITSLKTEEVDIVSRQDKLKKELYGRFGDSINLES